MRPSASWNRQSLVVERRALPPGADPSEGLALILPSPLSLNNLFSNIPGRGRVMSAKYKEWIEAAGKLVRSQRPHRVPGRVKVTLTVSDRNRSDLDNLAKCCLDLIVEHGIIDADNHATVRDIHLKRADIDGAVIEIEALIDDGPLFQKGPPA